MYSIFRGLFGRVFDDYYDQEPIKKGSTQKQYNNKNSNIEYYTDEKGNIRKRKLCKTKNY